MRQRAEVLRVWSPGHSRATPGDTLLRPLRPAAREGRVDTPGKPSAQMLDNHGF